MKLKLGIIVVFFSLISLFGFVSLNDMQKPVSIPIDGAFSIQGENSKSSSEVYKIVRNISKNKKIKIYKPVILDSGKVKYMKVDSSSNKNIIHRSPIVGIYYTLGKLSATDLNVLKETGLKVVYSKYPWYIGGLAQFDGLLRSFLIFSILLIFFLVLLVNESRKIKEGVIRRSVGQNTYYFGQDFAIPFLFNLSMVFVLYMGYCFFIGNGLGTYSSKLFLALLVTDFFIFQLIHLVMIFTIFLNIKFERITDIIKNKVKIKGIFVIWLAIMCGMILLSGFILKESKSSQDSLILQLKSLKPWSKVKTYSKLEVLGIENNEKQNGEDKDSEKSNKIFLEILSNIKYKKFMYIKPSNVFIPEFSASSDTIDSFKSQLLRDGITNSDVNKKLIYINKYGAELQNEINDTKFKNDNEKIATIYIPKQFKNFEESIINTVLAEQFTRTTFKKNEISTKIIPNGQQVFYFNEEASNNKKTKGAIPSKSEISEKNNIVVVLDTEKMIEQKDFVLASNITYNALFEPNAIKEISNSGRSLGFSINPINVYQTVELKIKSYEHQLLISKIVQIAIYLILFMSIYQYTKLFIISRKSDYVKFIILGYSKKSIAISNLKYSILFISMSVLLTSLYTGQYELFLLELILLFILSFSSINTFKILAKNYSQILKGDHL